MIDLLKNIEIKDTITEISALTGFTAAESAVLLSKTNWQPAEAVSNLKKLVSITTPVLEKETIQAGINQAGLAGKLADNLSKLNTMRGGTKGFKGFVAEYQQAAKASMAGKNTSVLNNNGIADLAYKGKMGTFIISR
ncbi:hypothetical protein [uncultured Acidaminococcus sp.]|uniref:hypothetical protein n=1 Tax=uncultured Acidaminococcus sp. TaxID=352152 RepID=UPI002943A2B1|nr:hypothetical protein [uncultured Acidaminococcus sp.]